METTKKLEVTATMGDFNAKIGQGIVEPCIGRYGFVNLIRTKTFFKLPKRRLHKWKDGIIRNQINYILKFNLRKT